LPLGGTADWPFNPQGYNHTVAEGRGAASATTLECFAARGKAAPVYGGIKIAANLRRRTRQRGD